jgi:hypothetical protein
VFKRLEAQGAEVRGPIGDVVLEALIEHWPGEASV